MCTNHQPNYSQLIKQSRHRYEWPLFGLAAVLTIITFVVVLSIAIFKQETLDFIKTESIASYRMDNPDNQHLSDEEVLANISDDEKAIISEIDGLSPSFIAIFPLLFILLIVYQVGKIYGGLRGDGIRVSEKQFPEVYAMWVEMAQKLGMEKIPELYIQNGNGALNAFATCIPGYRAFGTIYSDILERALANNDDKALRFILGHELGHIRLSHVAWWKHLFGMMGKLPIINYFVGLPLSRAQEYGCDKLGYYLSDDKDCQGLLMLATGKHLYQRINLAEYRFEQIEKRSYWGVMYNAMIDHPIISWRVAALQENRHGDLLWRSKK